MNNDYNRIILKCSHSIHLTTIIICLNKLAKLNKTLCVKLNLKQTVLISILE